MELSARRRWVVTVGLLTGIFLAATEATIIATAMPTIIGRLGGVSLYAWVFTAYLLTSTTSVPLYGKLADVYGRKPMYLVAVTIFLLGSLLCGMAQSMEQLVLFRALQGLGAGGVQPIALTVIGDIFSLEQRARVNGLFSAIWGMASIIAPVLGGLIVDYLAWQWIFFLNIPFGLISAAILGIALREPERRGGSANLDLAGAATLTAAVVAFQFMLLELRDRGPTDPLTIGLGAVTVALLTALVVIERRALDPVLPIRLWNNAIIRSATLGAFGLGIVVFGVPTFLPVLVQGARGGGATEAGIALIPLSVGWTVGAIVAGRTILAFGYRRTATTGSLAVIAGATLTAVWASAPMPLILTFQTLLGIGAGAAFSCFTISTANAVTYAQRGMASSATQFARTMGGTLGTALLGLVFTATLATQLQGIPGVDLSIANRLLDSHVRADLPAAVVAASSAAVAASLTPVFWAIVAIALLALLPSLLLPTGDPRRLRPAPDPNDAPSVADRPETTPVATRQ
ncbi:MAG: MFS transporter [Dehalococcoidia bacterium]|nr:MFS transporter [Dehalococcoidia bacterium]